MFERVAHGAVNVIQGTVPLNLEHVEDVRSLLRECLENGPPHVVLDLQNIQLIDSAGLELLLDFQEELQQLGDALTLAAPNSLCEEILIVTGISGGFEIFEEALSAVGSFVR